MPSTKLSDTLDEGPCLYVITFSLQYMRSKKILNAQHLSSSILRIWWSQYTETVADVLTNSALNAQLKTYSEQTRKQNGKIPVCQGLFWHSKNQPPYLRFSTQPLFSLSAYSTQLPRQQANHRRSQEYTHTPPVIWSGLPSRRKDFIHFFLCLEAILHRQTRTVLYLLVKRKEQFCNLWK